MLQMPTLHNLAFLSEVGLTSVSIFEILQCTALTANNLKWMQLSQHDSLQKT